MVCELLCHHVITIWGGEVIKVIEVIEVIEVIKVITIEVVEIILVISQVIIPLIAMLQQTDGLWGQLIGVLRRQ